MLFPLGRIRPDDDSRPSPLTGNVEEKRSRANVSKSFDVPKPPGPGEERPGFFRDDETESGRNEGEALRSTNIVTPGESVVVS